MHDGFAVLHNRHPVAVRVVDLDPPRVVVDVPSGRSHEGRAQRTKRLGGGAGGAVREAAGNQVDDVT